MYIYKEEPAQMTANRLGRMYTFSGFQNFFKDSDAEDLKDFISSAVLLIAVFIFILIDYFQTEVQEPFC